MTYLADDSLNSLYWSVQSWIVCFSYKVMTFNITFLYLLFNIKIQTLPLFRFYLSNQCPGLIFFHFAAFLIVFVTFHYQLDTDWSHLWRIKHNWKMLSIKLSRVHVHEKKYCVMTQPTTDGTTCRQRDSIHIYRNSNWAWARQL